MSEKTLTLDARQESCEDAVRYAKSQLASKNRDKETCTLDVTYDPRLVAGVAVNLQGFGQFSGKYIIKKAVHKISASGSKVSLELYKAGPSLDSSFAVRRSSEESLCPAGGASSSIGAILREALSFKAWKLPAALDYAPALEAYQLLDKQDTAELMAVEALAAPADDSPGAALIAKLFTRWLCTSGTDSAPPFTIGNLRELIDADATLQRLCDEAVRGARSQLSALPEGDFDAVAIPCTAWPEKALCKVADSSVWVSGVTFAVLPAGSRTGNHVSLQSVMLTAYGRFDPASASEIPGTGLTAADFTAYASANGRGNPFDFIAEPIALPELTGEHDL